MCILGTSIYLRVTAVLTPCALQTRKRIPFDLWEDIRHFLRNMDEYKDLNDLWKRAKRYARDPG